MATRSISADSHIVETKELFIGLDDIIVSFGLSLSVEHRFLSLGRGPIRRIRHGV